MEGRPSASSMNSWDSMSDLAPAPASANAEVAPITMSARMRAAGGSSDSLKSSGSGRPVAKEKPQEDFFASFGV